MEKERAQLGGKAKDMVVVEEVITPYLSNCCLLPAFVDGKDEEGTHYFVCSKCGNPCDVKQSQNYEEDKVVVVFVYVVYNRTLQIKGYEEEK